MTARGGLGEYLDGWARTHGGVVPRGLVVPWLRLTRTLAAPVAGLSPSVLTVGGVMVAGLSIVPAIGGRPWAGLVALAVLVSAVLDGLDGAVALMSGRVSRWGAVLDSVSDRVSDAAFLVALWFLGAPAGLAVAAGAAILLLEYGRARAMAVGVPVRVITVGERPSRVIVTVVGLLCGWGLGPAWFAATVAAVGALALLGAVQLLVVVRAATGRP